MPPPLGSTQPEQDSGPALSLRLEARWRAGERPPIEDLVAGLDGPARGRAVRRLIGVEFRLRQAAGERPTTTEYLVRFPEASDVLGFFGDDPGPGDGSSTAADPVPPDSRELSTDLVPDVSPGPGDDATVSRTLLRR